MKIHKQQDGILSIEATFALTIFIFLMLFMYSFLRVFEARNEIAHVLLSSANSIALDVYSNEKTENTGNIMQVIASVYNSVAPSNNNFTNNSLWNEVSKSNIQEGDWYTWDGKIYASDSGAAEARRKQLEKENSGLNPGDEYYKETVNDLGGYAVSSGMTSLIRERFVAYLADGNEEKANEILKNLNVMNGLDGLNFSQSYLSSGKLYLTVTYTIEYDFHIIAKGGLQLQQSCCSKIWK